MAPPEIFLLTNSKISGVGKTEKEKFPTNDRDAIENGSEESSSPTVVNKTENGDSSNKRTENGDISKERRLIALFLVFLGLFVDLTAVRFKSYHNLSSSGFVNPCLVVEELSCFPIHCHGWPSPACHRFSPSTFRDQIILSWFILPSKSSYRSFPHRYQHHLHPL